MCTEDFNHGPAQLAFHTGLNRNGNPGIGSWMSYALEVKTKTSLLMWLWYLVKYPGWICALEQRFFTECSPGR